MNDNNEEKVFQYDDEDSWTPYVEVHLGPEDGNSTRTRVVLTAQAGHWDFDSFSDGIVVECHGTSERLGLADALERVVQALRGKEGN